MSPAPHISRFKHIAFTPRLVPTIAAMAALALTMYLGAWQQGRAGEKRALQAQFDARTKLPPLSLDAAANIDATATYRRATAAGEYDASGQFFLDNKNDGMVVGYHVITPLKLADTSTTRYVLVNRGFVARGTTYPTPPAVAVPTGLVAVNGTLASPNSRFLELGNAQATAVMPGKVWQNLTIDRYRTQSGREVLPLVLLAAPADAGLIARQERPDARAEKHIEYMLTWYSLAATVVVLWLVVNLKFPRTPKQEN